MRKGSVAAGCQCDGSDGSGRRRPASGALLRVPLQTLSARCSTTRFTAVGVQLLPPRAVGMPRSPGSRAWRSTMGPAPASRLGSAQGRPRGLVPRRRGRRCPRPLRRTRWNGPRCPPKADASGFRCLWSGFGALADRRPLPRGHGDVDVQHEGVHVGAKLRDDEGHALGHQPAHERNVTSKAVRLGDSDSDGDGDGASPHAGLR